MKWNKFVLVFSLLILSFLACSSDDDGGNPSGDPIIGEWQLDRVIFEGTELSLQPCEDLETFIFEAEGGFFNERYSTAPHIPDQDCELQNTSQGAWIIDDNGIYFINLQGDFVELPVSINEEAGELTLNETDPATGMTQQRIFVLQSTNE
ncbi:MAG: lipocalin family protein [Flavobacteriaceae bacterium]|nr:lipocalin family protein [Flavobacteriaceae bacterium]